MVAIPLAGTVGVGLAPQADPGRNELRPLREATKGNVSIGLYGLLLHRRRLHTLWNRANVARSMQTLL